MKLHPIPPGLWCVPSALVAITGADFETVIHPALNRHSGEKGALTRMVVGSTWAAAVKTLEELRYRVRPYRHADRHTVRVWARRSLEMYHNRILLVQVPEHVVVIHNGKVYDTWSPHGASGEMHAYAKDVANRVVLVEKL